MAGLGKTHPLAPQSERPSADRKRFNAIRFHSDSLSHQRSSSDTISPQTCGYHVANKASVISGGRVTSPTLQSSITSGQEGLSVFFIGAIVPFRSQCQIEPGRAGRGLRLALAAPLLLSYHPSWSVEAKSGNISFFFYFTKSWRLCHCPNISGLNCMLNQNLQILLKSLNVNADNWITWCYKSFLGLVGSRWQRWHNQWVCRRLECLTWWPRRQVFRRLGPSREHS